MEGSKLKVIVAEKPSLAQTIIAAIGNGKFKREDGYAESSDYIVTWSFGHLFELADLDSYLPSTGEEKRRWSLEGLPFCPTEFHFELKKDPKTKKVDGGVRKQFGIIKTLINRKDVDAVIHAGDSDREGEIIIRKILEMAGNRKKVYRLWLPAQEHEDIRAGLREMRLDEFYDDLAKEGNARTYVDWLFGINLTRTATVKSGSLIRVGRVIVPIVKAIYDRDMEIKNFKPVPYFTVVSEEETNGEKVKLTCKQTFKQENKAEAQALADKLNAQRAVVTDIKTEEKTISAGKLLSQSDLQGLAGKKYKMTPKETLEIAQKLYENGYTTYPRTPTQYLATSERDKINRVIGTLQKKGYKVTPKDKQKTIYDSSKVESHSAITPTNKIPAPGDLNAKEQKIYDIILNRFLAVFCSEPCKVDHTTMVISVGDMEFRLTGDVFLQRGWMEYDESSRNDKILPKLAVGDEVNILFQLVGKETKPPSHYTVKTLGDFLQNPFRKGKPKAEETDANDKDDDEPEEPELVTEDEIPDDDEDYKAILSGLEIGTEATRADIIDKAIASQYIALKNNKYTILPGGEYYIETLWKMGIIMDKYKTAELGRTLKQVYRGEISIQDAVDHAMTEVQAFYDSAVATEVEKQAGAGLPNGVICSCPIPGCGGDVKEGKKGYYCSNYKTCTLNGLWKNACYVNITPKDVAALLKGSTISKPYTTKNGFKMTKKLRYDISEGKILDVSNEPMTAGKPKDGEETQSVACPVCHSPILDRPTSFSCSNSDCGLTLWKQSRFGSNTVRITPAKAKVLLSGGHVLYSLTSKAGKNYEGYLKLKINGKYANLEPDGFPD